MKKSNKNISGLISNLKKYWIKQGLTIMQPVDIMVGAGTFHPITFFYASTSNKISSAYVQLSRRPNDGRYAKNPYRMQEYYQFQVIIKPVPKNIQNIYINSLSYLNINLLENDIKFIEDNWKNDTLGASGVGWEVWLNGIEITQFTYFQQIGSINCDPTAVEITYGIERISMVVQEVDNIYDLIWSDKNDLNKVTYHDLFYNNEVEKSKYNFEYANISFLFKIFHNHIEEAKKLLNLSYKLPIPAYEHIMQACHYFNILESRKAISVSERQKYILKIKNMTKLILQAYINNKNIM
ncbi:glycine--tRNA ligase subunit alpha [Buchnera aphidicola (Taiwanaphis decaspermi)]|uniref:glycine--tRNA ligase subunit alpha n=1 Tax=Buchnera aphidicola TaxID=9 RepID=UPI0031B8B247